MTLLKLNKYETEFITSIIKESAVDSTIYLSLFKKKDFEFQIVGQYKTKTIDSILKLDQHNKNFTVHRNDTIWTVLTNNLRIISNNKLYLKQDENERRNSILNKFVNNNNNFVYSKNNTFTNEFLPKSISNLFKGDSYIKHSDNNNKVYVNGIVSYSDSIPSIFKALKHSRKLSIQYIKHYTS